MKRILPATLLCDFYKVSHREQYPLKTEKVYSTWTPRATRMTGIKRAKAFGFQMFIKKYLMEYFNENFFNRPKSEVVEEYKRVIRYCLFVEEPYTKHIEDLHDLGYLPIKIKAVKEGTSVPIRVPMLSIENTDDRFFWLTNFLETLMSCELWLPINSATIADEYKRILTKWSLKTTGTNGFVQFQAHDFSMRGMGGLEAAILSGMGHLTSFVGTDTVPAILELENYYCANIETELVGCSVPATEHSVMCAGGKADEFETYKRLITEVYPKGIVSIVSDTWDLWYVLKYIIPALKQDILARDGKVVIRPDSGDPADIICGHDYDEEENLNGYSYDSKYIKCMEDGKFYKVEPYDSGWTTKYNFTEVSEAEIKGVIELLWDTFGGKVNELGYKELDSHIGAIYGDAITLERADEICSRLAAKGFASTNIVFGVGSFTYQYKTRDSLGQALKSTHVVNDSKEYNIFKDPVTDDGTKKSQTGRVVVIKDSVTDEISFIDGLTIAEQDNLEDVDLLEDVFTDGVLIREQTLSEIRGM